MRWPNYVEAPKHKNSYTMPILFLYTVSSPYKAPNVRSPLHRLTWICVILFIVCFIQMRNAGMFFLCSPECVCVNGSLLTCVLWQPVCCSSLGIIIFTVCFQLSGTCEEIIGVPWLDLLQDSLKTSWCLCPVTHTQSSIFNTLSILFTASIHNISLSDF